MAPRSRPADLVTPTNGGSGVHCDGLEEVRWSAALALAQIPPADLNVPVVGQLTPAQLPLGDGLEPGPLEVVRFDAPFGGGPVRHP